MSLLFDPIHGKILITIEVVDPRTLAMLRMRHKLGPATA